MTTQYIDYRYGHNISVLKKKYIVSISIHYINKIMLIFVKLSKKKKKTIPNICFLIIIFQCISLIFSK